MTTLNSTAQLAAHFGIAERTIYKWKKRDGWKWKRPYPVEEIAEWINTEYPKSPAADNPEYESVDHQLKKKRIEKLEEELRVIRNEVIDRAVVDAALNKICQIFVKALDDALMALPVRLQGLDVGQIEAELKNAIRLVRLQLSETKEIEVEIITQSKVE